jgi:hypothetical protein
MCEVCPSGTNALEGSKSLDECKCPVNTYFTSGSEPCTNCVIGLVSVHGSTSIEDCMCPTDQYLDTVTMICVACPDGSVSTGDLLFSGCHCAMDAYMDAGSSTCVACPVSHISPFGSVDLSACICEADTYMDGIACLDCPAWSNTNGSVGAIVVTECLCGKHRLFDSVDNTCPLSCPNDMRAVPSGDVLVLPSVCEVCVGNTYAKNGLCVNCPMSSVSGEGSSSITQCICIPGMYMNFTYAECVDCGIGNYCPGITSSLICTLRVLL